MPSTSLSILATPETFHCDRIHASLTQSTCAKRHLARTAPRFGAGKAVYPICGTCPDGAARATQLQSAPIVVDRSHPHQTTTTTGGPLSSLRNTARVRDQAAHLDAQLEARLSGSPRPTLPLVAPSNDVASVIEPEPVKESTLESPSIMVETHAPANEVKCARVGCNDPVRTGAPRKFPVLMRFCRKDCVRAYAFFHAHGTLPAWVTAPATGTQDTPNERPPEAALPAPVAVDNNAFGNAAARIIAALDAVDAAGGLDSVRRTINAVARLGGLESLEAIVARLAHEPRAGVVR